MKARFVMDSDQGKVMINAHTEDKVWEFEPYSLTGDLLSFADMRCRLKGAAILELTDPFTGEVFYYTIVKSIPIKAKRNTDANVQDPS